jgi:hypothetical protein
VGRESGDVEELMATKPKPKPAPDPDEPEPEPEPDDEDEEPIAARLTALEDRMTKLEERVNAPPIGIGKRP